MAEAAHAGILVMLVGGAVVASIVLRALAGRIGVPALVAFLALGIALRGLADATGVLPPSWPNVLDFLGTLGLAMLLFRVGLESRLSSLLGQLRGAAPVWLGNVVVSGLAGYAVARLAGLPELTSIVIGVALTATSVAVPTSVWTDADRLQTPEGQRFVDVAELDDVSGIVMMALLLGVLPTLLEGGGGTLPALASTAVIVLVKLIAFVAVCALLYRFGEPHVAVIFGRLQPQPEPILGVVGLGLIIAAAGALLGFSVAIGAFFAGLVFSRDPQHVHERTSFRGLYELLIPFFFISVGFSLPPTALVAGLGLGLVLAAAAIVGKLIGATLPALATAGAGAALLLGVSMVPRAEITLAIGSQVRAFGDILPVEAYSALVLVVAITSTLGAIALAQLLRRQPRNEEAG